MPSKRQTIPYGVNQDSAPPASGVVSERGSTMRSTGTRRRRASDVEELKVPPHVSPLPQPAPALPRDIGLDIGLHVASTASTATTQPMPTLTEEEVATATRPAILPPSLPFGSRATEPAPRSDRSARRAKLETPGVYRFTTPDSERRKKR